MRHRFHAIFLFLSISALSAAFFACSAKNSSNADYIDDDYSSEYDEFSSSSDDLSGNASSSSGQKTSSSAESSSSLTSSSSEEYVVSKTSALLDSIYDSRNSRTYKTVQIGSNVWLAQNLSYKTTKSKCYDDRLENCEVFGRLYKVYSDSLCPTGFSLPTKENWESLIKIAGSTELLKTSRYWEKSDKAKRGNDSLGLSLVPGGLCGVNAFGEKLIVLVLRVLQKFQLRRVIQMRLFDCRILQHNLLHAECVQSLMHVVDGIR